MGGVGGAGGVRHSGKSLATLRSHPRARCTASTSSPVALHKFHACNFRGQLKEATTSWLGSNERRVRRGMAWQGQVATGAIINVNFFITIHARVLLPRPHRQWGRAAATAQIN